MLSLPLYLPRNQFAQLRDLADHYRENQTQLHFQPAMRRRSSAGSGRTCCAIPAAITLPTRAPISGRCKITSAIPRAKQRLFDCPGGQPAAHSNGFGDAQTMPIDHQEEDIVAELVGFRIRHGLAPGQQLLFRADVGGFDVGSEFSWNIAAAYSFDFAVRDGVTYSGVLGYRALSVDYVQGSGTSRYEYDVVQHGPIVGVTLRW